MKKVLTSFEKAGKNINVILNMNVSRKTIQLENEGITVNVVRIWEDRKHGYCYTISKSKAEKLFDRKFKTEYVEIKSETAKLVEIESEKLYKEYKEKVINEAFGKVTDDTQIRLSKGTSHTFVYLDIENADKHIFFKESKKLIHELNEKDIKEVLNRGYDDVDWGDYSITYTYKMTFLEYKKLVEFAKEKQLEKEKEAQEKKEKADRKEKAIFQKAKETNEKQILRSWSEPCNDPEEECNIDTITIWALPNGETRLIRSHTW